MMSSQDHNEGCGWSLLLSLWMRWKISISIGCKIPLQLDWGKNFMIVAYRIIISLIHSYYWLILKIIANTFVGASYMQRRLLSVDKVLLHRPPNGDLPFQPIVFVVAGVMILVIAGSLCTACTQGRDRDDESV